MKSDDSAFLQLNMAQQPFPAISRFKNWQKTWPILGAFYIAAGVAHFTAAEAFESIYPPEGTWGFWYLPGSAPGTLTGPWVAGWVAMQPGVSKEPAQYFWSELE